MIAFVSKMLRMYNVRFYDVSSVHFRVLKGSSPYFALTYPYALTLFRMGLFGTAHG